MIRRTALVSLVCALLGYAAALGDAFVCPEYLYPVLRSHELGTYRLHERGPHEDSPQYVLHVELQRSDGARWCFIADSGRYALVGGGDVREPIDLQGNGVIDVVIQLFGIGNYCDESVYAIELADEPRFLYRAESYHYTDHVDARAGVCDVAIADLDRDARFELITYDAPWSNRNAPEIGCSHAATPYIAIAFAYREGAGYEVVDPYATSPLLDPTSLRELQSTNMARAMRSYLTLLRDRTSSSFPYEHRCNMLSIALPLVYGGEWQFAREVLDTLYLLEDADAMWETVVDFAQASQFFRESWGWMGP